MPEMWLENAFGAFLEHSPKVVQRLVLRLVYWIIEEIDSYLPQTTSAKMAAGSAICAVQKLNIAKTLEEPTLPRHVSSLIATFEPDQWREVLQLAVMSDSEGLHAELVDPRWVHLCGDSAGNLG